MSGYGEGLHGDYSRDGFFGTEFLGKLSAVG